MDKCPVTGQSAMSQETEPKAAKQSNTQTPEVNYEVMARKAEIFDIQVGQDTLKVKWDELEKLKSKRLTDLQALLQSLSPNEENQEQKQESGEPNSQFGKLPVVEVNE